jgi:hypothetical protein
MINHIAHLTYVSQRGARLLALASRDSRSSAGTRLRHVGRPDQFRCALIRCVIFGPSPCNFHRHVRGNITVTCMARPRPRTHAGKASCAEMLRLDTAAIQGAPAMKLATIAVAGWRARANNAVASAVPRLATATRESAPNFSPSRRKRNARRRLKRQ